MFGLGTTPLLAALGVTLGSAGTIVSAQEIDRTAFPIAAPVLKPITEPDARNAKAPPRFEVKAPRGAPNID